MRFVVPSFAALGALVLAASTASAQFAGESHVRPRMFHIGVGGGVSVGALWWVSTRTTPGWASACAVSSDVIRPRAIGCGAPDRTTIVSEPRTAPSSGMTYLTFGTSSYIW